MECKCPDWEPNTKKLNSYLLMGVIHGMDDWKAVNGKPFQFCPWCGSQLLESLLSQQSSKNPVEIAPDGGILTHVQPIEAIPAS